MSIEMECVASIVKWIMDNPGYVHSQFTFAPEHEDEILPTAREFEMLTYDTNAWSKDLECELTDEETELYPGAVSRQKYIFDPLNGNLYAHVFLEKEGNILYIVVGT